VSEAREVAMRLLVRGVAAGRTVGLQVVGRCMEPVLSSGDRIEVERLVGAPRSGDLLVAHSSDGTLICHRLVAVDASGLWLAAERSLVAHPYPHSAILGSVHRFVHRGCTVELERSAARWLDQLAAVLQGRSPRYAALSWVGWGLRRCVVALRCSMSRSARSVIESHSGTARAVGGPSWN